MIRIGAIFAIELLVVFALLFRFAAVDIVCKNKANERR
jgi:hypothetical protein